MGSNFLRTEEGNRCYAEHKKAAGPNAAQFSDIQERTIREFEHWYLIENLFPYDKIATVHHLLIPKREVAFGEPMLPGEEEELLRIKKELAPEYDAMTENFPRNQSVPGHFHLHLLVYKEIE
jgi:diadenosine tetraphosphate (Ap4A) HIT family hydrolase